MIKTINNLKKALISFDSLKHVIKINSRLLLILSFCYLYIPLLIFFLTWTKLFIGIPCILACLYGVLMLIKDSDKEDELEIGIIPLCFIAAFLLITGFVAGWGGWMPQSGDWAKHNAVLYDLLSRSWPVYYKDAVNPSMLTYYIGQYLVSVLFGKIFSSFRAAEVMMYVWAECGLFLVVFNLLHNLKIRSVKKQAIAVIVTVFFSGCLILAQNMYCVFYNVMSTSVHWMTEVDGSLLQYRSNFVDLRWVMPQCLSCWISVTLLWKRRDKEQHFAAILCPLFLTGIFQFLGLTIISLCCAVINVILLRCNFVQWIKRLFSLQNVLIAALTGGVLLLYYSGNVFSEKGNDAGFHMQNLNAWLYLSFVIASFGLYCLFVWKKNKKNGLFLGSVVLLLILPFFSVGLYNDLVMCTSIPALFIVMICVLDYLFSVEKNQIVTGALIVLLLIGALNPMKEMIATIKVFSPRRLQQCFYYPNTLSAFSDLENKKVDDALKYNYFSYNVDNNLFISYIARESITK